jgi:hypothetical protein
MDIAAVAAALMIHSSNLGNRSAYVNYGWARYMLSFGNRPEESAKLAEIDPSLRPVRYANQLELRAYFRSRDA